MTVDSDTVPPAAPQAATSAPPHPLREFWGYFSANRGAVAGLVVIVLIAARRDLRAAHRAASAER